MPCSSCAHASKFDGGDHGNRGTGQAESIEINQQSGRLSDEEIEEMAPPRGRAKASQCYLARFTDFEALGSREGRYSVCKTLLTLAGKGLASGACIGSRRGALRR